MSRMMAQVTSDFGKTLLHTKHTRKEYGFDINGAWYGPESEVTHSVDSGLYEDFSIGNATTAKLTLTLYTDSIPRSATIKRYVRLKNGEQVSEWIPKGIFFTNRRGKKDGRWTIEAFDAMRKADVIWGPGESLQFPLTMPDTVKEFARIMGVEIDPRTVLNSAHTIDYPNEDYTIRDILQYTHNVGIDVLGSIATRKSVIQTYTNYYVSLTTGSAGGDAPHNNMPPYYALCYIMKLYWQWSSVWTKTRLAP